MARVSTGPTASSAAWVKGVLRMFASQGVDIPRLLQAAGIDSALLDQPHTRLDLEQVNQLWRFAVTASGQQALGLQRELAARYINLEIAATWTGSGATLRSVLENQSHYAELVNDASAFSLVPEHPDAWVAFTHGNDKSFPRQRIEYAMLAMALVCQRATRRQLRPLAAEFVFSEPADLHRHRMAFPCPLRFDRPVNRLLFAAGDLALPVASGSPTGFALEERVLEALLAALGSNVTSFRVAQELVRRLRQGESQAGPVAASVGLTEADLKRKLKSERTSIDELMDRVRRELAHEYLAGSAAPLAGIAQLLGLQDDAEFTVACRRWFAKTPSEYRRHHGPDLPGP